VCATQIHGSLDEVGVKKSNEFQENWDIVRADGHPITLFVSRCAPADF